VNEGVTVEPARSDRRLHALGLAVFLAGCASIAGILIGPPAVITYYGWTPYTSIVTALRTDTTAVVTIGAMSVALVALLAGAATYRRMPSKRSREWAVAGAVLGAQAVFFGAFVLWYRAGIVDRFTFHFLNFEKLEGYGGAFVQGAKNTVLLAVLGEIGGIVLGVVLALLLISKRRTVRAPARVYVNVFRGTPLLVQLIAGYLMIVFAFQARISPFAAATLIFVLNTGAYAAEVFRAGIQSVERGQLEAARSLGMTYVQSMRHAILPQAFRRVIPPLMNEFVILIKDTALVGAAIGLTASEFEIYAFAREGYSSTFNATFFFAASLAYLAVTLPAIYLVNRLERRLRSGLVGVAG
jgi:His/Glu/Gln/Arg/opine family amino acid ABC transporter permease subunit